MNLVYFYERMRILIMVLPVLNMAYTLQQLHHCLGPLRGRKTDDSDSPDKIELKKLLFSEEKKRVDRNGSSSGYCVVLKGR